MRYLFICLLFSMVLACNTATTDTDTNTSKDSTAQRPNDEEEPANKLSGCYMKVSGRDTVLVNINQSGTSISGTMRFDNYQIDGSSGTLKGNMEGDELRLWYDFNAEGSRSYREMSFKKTDDKLILGTGGEEYKGDSSYIRNRSAIKYEDKNTFNKVDCPI